MGLDVRKALVGLVLMVLALPAIGEARAIHYFECNDCHRPGSGYTGLKNITGLCDKCHNSEIGLGGTGGQGIRFSDGSTGNQPSGKFVSLDASNAMGRHPNSTDPLLKQTSHFWSGTDLWPAAGAQAPANLIKYGKSTSGWVACSRCHNPHTEDIDANAGSHMLRVPFAGDAICLDCHRSWNVANVDAVLTHPKVVSYATIATAKPNDFNATPVNVGSGDVRLVNGGVSCTSCHGLHFTDSNTSTADGMANAAGLATGDGKILRADGELRTGLARNTAVTGTAQLRSNLCQACHKIELHGQGLSGDHKIGCLECHGGHSFNGGTPSAFILRDQTPGAVPTRPNGVNSGSNSIVTFGNFPAGTSTRLTWADENQGGTAGFCERCHGDANSAAMVTKSNAHAVGYNPPQQEEKECSYCHKHNDPANSYSFNRDASAATCGQCHGFPPYLSGAGDRPPTGTGVDGGYAVNASADPNTPYDYVNSTTHEKDETTTGHKVHAGRDLTTSPANTSAADWYFVGASGIDNCKVCHGPDAGSTAGGHRIAPATRPDTFRDVPFDGIAKTGMSPVPQYNISTPWTCINVYCHTNGAPYNGALRPNRVYTRVNTTPPWVGNGTTYALGGYGSIHGKAYECASCHGNTAATMATGVDPMKSNSVAHLAHLGGATTLNMAKSFSCSVCHVQTATTSTALAVNAMDGRAGGKHVNGLIDVDFETGSTPNTLPEALTGSTYTAASGVCSTYCHNVTGVGGAMAADWDIATDMQCDSCHGGLATDISGNGGYGPIATSSHTRHVTAATGPTLACAECHGTGSDAGTHGGHFDGQVNMKPPVDGVTFFDICEECHGFDAENGEVNPDWGVPGSTDCATCHAGIQCGADFEGKSPPVFNFARSVGHNRLTATGPYPVSGNLAANSNCADCHVATSGQHWDGITGNSAMLRTDLGFPAAYSTAADKNNFCGNCHGSAPAHPTKAASPATRSINTHQGKLCIACHDLHGTINIQMIINSQTVQNTNDISAGAYTGTVAFFAVSGPDSFDEDDVPAGSAGELNADDLCATCHTDPPTTHNNSNNTDDKGPTGHQMGNNCFPCHASHADPTNAFKVGAGTACNDCHGYPPNTGAHGNGTNKHTRIIDPVNIVNEDRTDCAYCHTGANLYTFDLSADQAASGARANHAVSRANRQLVMQNNLNVGFNNNGTPTNSSDDTCTTACHATSLSDGFWTDANGLDCNACHYYAASPVAVNNLSDVHDEHFAKGKTCSACHSMTGDYNSGASHVAPLTHINSFDFGTGNDGNDGAALLDMAQATQDEAGYDEGAGVRDVLPAMNYTDANTCSGGGGLGCHASGTPDWDVIIPATSAGCVMCHTTTAAGDAAYNPTSGVHGNSPAPTVTGNAHDGSFDNGSAGIADCVTCHTASPTAVVANHINGTLNTGAAITVAASAGYNAGTADCATTCHSAGTPWRYKWSNTAYATNGNECANCHGMYGSWATGVAPHTEVATKGNRHNSVGTLTYPCSDCHAIGSAGYNWASKWNPNAASSHGDDKITMNSVAGTNVFAIDTAATPDRAGCTTTSCHNLVANGGITADTTHTFPITTTAFTTQTVTGTAPAVSCSTCHGGFGGTNANGYWPNDGTNTISNASENNSGAHLKHMTALAQSVYSETLAQLLTNNGNGTADAKQKFLCAYCHNTPGSDGDHGVQANLPAEVNSMYAMWDITRSTADNGFYNRDVDKTCATVNCHNNKTTPTVPSNTWYTIGSSACIMCHVDITNGAVPSSNGGSHVAHTSAAASFGRTITCNDCHKTASETVAWGSPGTPPTNLHMNGTFTVTGTVPFTYTAGQGCATNVCHNAGNGVTAPASGATSYPWGTALANCTICHAAVPSVTPAHSAHLGNATLVPNGCNECHDAATLSTHIDATVDFGGVVTAPLTNASYNGSCTNNCHVAGAGDWAGGAAALACTDCHSGSYVGGNNWRVSGNNYLALSGLHVTTATNVTPHNQTLAGGCTACHTAYASAPVSHVDNVWQADGPANSESRFVSLAGYSELAVNSSTCSGAALTGCHTDQGSWSRLWSTAADSDYIATPATGQTVCNVCHGSYSTITNSTGWRAGTVHARSGGTKGSGHTDANIECEDCHAYPGVAGKHEDGFITMSGDTNAVLTTGEDYQLAWGTHGTNPGWYCASCHNGVAAEDALTGTTHTFVDSLAFPSPTKTPTHEKIRYADGASAPEGGCTGCHGNTGTGGYWPDGSKGGVRTAGTSGPADRPGKHAQHVWEVAKKKYSKPSPSAAEQNTTCDYCHPNPGAGGHNDATAPADMHNGTTTKFKRIITPFGLDNDGVVSGSGTAYVTCNNIDCHFDMPRTPQWYTDNVLPDAATGIISAAAGTTPRSIEVTWSAPGDDGVTPDTTPYVYDLRMGTTAGISQDFGLTENALGTGANYAGNLPAAYKQGSASKAIIQNLTPGTYHFTLRTRDTEGNWSTSSNTVSATPAVDSTAPVFGGADKATRADRGQTVYLYWTPAEDHSMPITYQVWYKAESVGAIDFGVAPNLTGVKAHEIQIEGLTNDELYYFAVRACDANSNCDTNTAKVSATPTTDPTIAKTNELYRANAAAASSYVTMNKGATFTTAATTATLPVTFRPGANLTYGVNYFVDSFRTYITNANNISVIRATLGTSTGANFTPIAGAPTPEVTMGNRAKGIKSFKFGDLGGRTVPSGSRIAVQLTLVSGGISSVGWGSAANDGSLTTAEQIVNLPPTNPNVGATVSGANVNITWTASTDSADGVTTDIVHYDLFGSDDNGGTYRYLIATGLSAATTNYSWNTQEDGIAGSATVAVKLLPGDGFTHYTGAGTTVTGLAVNNTNDNIAPRAINDLVARARPKSGSVELTWTAPGDDDYNNGRAKYYDIRYSTAAINEGNFASATQCVNEPSPDFGGKVQSFEVTGLNPGQIYYFAIKTYDDGSPAKVSAISTAKAVGTDQALGGPRCGMCHTTAPSIVESVGNHKLHGFTLKDCTKCHGAGVATYGLDHQDGALTMGYGPGGAQTGIISGNRIYYTNDGTPGGTVMYDDVDGFGGFGNGSYTNVGDFTDDGTCMNFGTMGVSGCHSTAGMDPDGGGPLPTYLPAPTWTAAASLNCSACHGNPSRTTDSFYLRVFDATVANGMVVPDQIKGAPVVDNHGNYKLTIADGALDEKDRKYIGQHEKHLNYSFRFAKGDNCNLCHSGNYVDVNNLDGKHGNGDVDVKLDKVGAGPNATWTPGTATTAGSCSNMSAETCHPSGSVKWDSNVNFDCVQCHGFGGTTPSHVTDPNGGVTLANNGWATDPMPGNCTYCHFGGHPKDDIGGTALILLNSPQVGINYRSGGIHLKKALGGRATMNDTSVIDTEAELCWGCHEDNGISEWGTDTGYPATPGTPNNTSTRPPNSNNYNFGTLNKTSWIGATWTSGNAAFGYKTQTIQSTHTTSAAGSAALTSDRFRTHTETVDAVGVIRCSNCHDVHNLNKAPGDNPGNLPAQNGPPYLRGTWLSSPYLEDGAPQSGTTYTGQNAYGAVPRAGSAYVASGGYYIDQNSGNPTAGYSLATSGGLCTLCHGVNVDAMDKTLSENLWLGTNGHSNAVIGGTASAKANIFDTGTGTAGQYGAYSGRPTPVSATARANEMTSSIPDMGYQNHITYGEGHGYRGTQSATYNGLYTPNTNPASSGYAFNSFDWGVSVDATTTDVGYHSFTCSKCHNPHASRLPKLMITNCLDVKKNTWDDNKTSQTTYTSTGNTDQGKKTASYDSAQNCHRLNYKFTYTATVISFTSPDKIVTSTANYFTTATNGFKVGDRVKITGGTGGTNNGKVGTISVITATQLTLTGVTDASGAATTITTAAAGTSATLEGIRGGWNKVTPW